MPNAKAACEALVDVLSSSQDALDRLTRRLQDEVDYKFAGAGVNPVDLARRINSLQRELPKLKQSCAALIENKQGLIDAAKQQLMLSHHQLATLSRQSGYSAASSDSVLKEFRHAVSEWDSQLAVQRQSGLPALGEDEKANINKLLALSVVPL